MTLSLPQLCFYMVSCCDSGFPSSHQLSTLILNTSRKAVLHTLLLTKQPFLYAFRLDLQSGAVISQHHNQRQFVKERVDFSLHFPATFYH